MHCYLPSASLFLSLSLCHSVSLTLLLPLFLCHHLPALASEPVDFENPISNLDADLVCRPAALHLCFDVKVMMCLTLAGTQHGTLPCCEASAGTKPERTSTLEDLSGQNNCTIGKLFQTWVITGRPSRISYLMPRLIAPRREKKTWSTRVRGMEGGHAVAQVGRLLGRAYVTVPGPGAPARARCAGRRRRRSLFVFPLCGNDGCRGLAKKTSVIIKKPCAHPPRTDASPPLSKGAALHPWPQRPVTRTSRTSQRPVTRTPSRWPSWWPRVWPRRGLLRGCPPRLGGCAHTRG